MDLIKNSLAEHNIQRFNESIYLDVLRKNPALQMCLSAIYIIIFVVGIFGNVLVCFVVGNNKAMQTVTNLFIANLSISDILLCVLALPFTPLYFFLNEWPFGSALCHMLPYSQSTSVYVSTLTLTSIAIDRFFVILYPFKPRMQMSTCLILICCIWLVALGASLPYGLFVTIINYENRTFCEENWDNKSYRLAYGAITSVMQFVVPFIIMAFAYTSVSLKLADRSREKAKIRLKSFRGEELDRERKRRTNRMLIAMVTIFGASWLPLNLVNLVNDVEYEPTIDWFWTYQNLLFFFAHTVAMSSTCYNVFLYAWLNDSFRKELKRVLPLFFRPLNTNEEGAAIGAGRAANRRESNLRNGQSGRHLDVSPHGIQDAQILLPEPEVDLSVNKGVAAGDVIELAPLKITDTKDTCPQCLTSMKTSFMNFDELNITSDPLPRPDSSQSASVTIPTLIV